jgi:hypothetical protein
MKKKRRQLKESVKRKLSAIALIIAGALSTLIDGDGTFFVFSIIIGIVIFFAKDYDCEDEL